MVKFHNWAVTINNPNPTELARVEYLKAIKHEDAVYTQFPYELDILFFVCGFENFFNGKTPHLQVFVSMRTAHTLQEMKSFLLFRRAHLEPCDDIESYITYCQKELVCIVKGDLLLAKAADLRDTKVKEDYHRRKLLNLIRKHEQRIPEKITNSILGDFDCVRNKESWLRGDDLTST
jgi:hypothetical protein